jgi:hypothetical protein
LEIKSILRKLKVLVAVLVLVHPKKRKEKKNNKKSKRSGNSSPTQANQLREDFKQSIKLETKLQVVPSLKKSRRKIGNLLRKTKKVMVTTIV